MSTQTFNFDAHIREQSFMTHTKLSASCSSYHFLLALARENGTRARRYQMRNVETHNKVWPHLFPYIVQHQSSLPTKAKLGRRCQMTQIMPWRGKCSWIHHSIQLQFNCKAWQSTTKQIQLDKWSRSDNAEEKVANFWILDEWITLQDEWT